MAGGVPAALAGTTVLTAAAHLSPLAIAGTVPGMFAFTWLRWRTGCLLPCGPGHAGYNAAVMAVYLVTGSF